MGRIEKVNQQLRREISQIIQQELSDPRLEFVSITQVDTSRDLHYARVQFSVIGEDLKAQDAQRALDSARGMIRKLIGQRLTLRYIPELDFELDMSIVTSARIEETLKEIKKEQS